MKLTKNEKNLRKIMKEGFMGQGGELFSDETSGMTVAVRLTCWLNSRFCEVSLAFCDFSEDTFNRKRGEFVVLQKWEHGNFVKVPMYANKPSDIANMFFEMFGE
jgi:hypothetical protein